MSILIALTPAESKRLIGKAVAIHPLVKKAMLQGNILVSGGTTTGYFVEELLNASIEIQKFPSGVVTQGVLCQTPDDRIRSMFFKRGILQENDTIISDFDELENFLSHMTYEDVYIKGANALDIEGNAGFLLAHPNGGNIMYSLPKVYAQGVHFIIPVGLEKFIPSVPNAQRNMKGINQYNYTFGRGCGYVSVNNGIIMNEITSLEMLTGVHATHVGSGGVGGLEGSVTLVIEGTEKQEQETIKLLNEIKGEPPIQVWKKKCVDCTYKCKFRCK